jgi:hypothetical protein
MNGNDEDILNRTISKILHLYNGTFIHGSTAHYRLSISNYTNLNTLNDAFSDEFINNIKHHLLIIDYTAKMNPAFRSTFEQSQLIPFLKSLIKHEKFC